jgi:chaperonin GroEL
MSKEVLFSEAQQSIKRGIDKISNAVKSTLGPRGQNVIIRHQYGAPTITKDGVTVARHIDLEDQLEDIGAQLIKAVAGKTVDSVGDGTTTATVLAQAIFTQGLRNIVAGANPVELKAGMDIAVKAVVESLKSQSRKVETLEQTIQVATISTNGDAELGKLIAEAIHQVGENGIVMCREGHKTSTEVKLISGMQIDSGYASPYFATDTDKMVCEMENPYILISDKKILQMKMILPILEQVLPTNKPLIIIADVEGEALATLVLNKTNGRIRVVTVKPPIYWNLDQYQDIAIATGTEVVSDVRGIKIENVKLALLGSAEKVTISSDSTIIAAGSGAKQDIEDRIQRLKNDKEQPNADKELLEARVAKLSGGIAIITVGGATEVEVRERRDRVEDAIFATRAAVMEGIIPGGGLALFRASKSATGSSDNKKDVITGWLIIIAAIQEPLRVIIENCGKNPDVVIEKINDSLGYNANTDKYEDLIEAGIIDPTKVARLALENAASIIGLLLNTKAFVIETVKPVK